MNEFRAELAAKNVRLTAVEEELNALKAKMDNVRITGGFRFREDLNQFSTCFRSAACAAGANLNGNPRSSAAGTATIARGNRPRYEFKLGFDGSVSPETHLLVALDSATGFQFFNSSNYGFGNSQNSNFTGEQGACCSIDNFFLDYKPAWGPGWEFRLGRFGNDTPCGGNTCYPIQFGPYGLLLNNNNNTWEDSTFDSGQNFADGLWLLYNNKDWADMQFQAVWLRITGGIGSSATSYPSGEDAYGFDANFSVMSGLRVGLNYVGNTIGNTPQPGGINQFAHLYGPGAGGTINAAGPRCTVQTALGGFSCPALGSGWGVYANWDAWPGIHVDAEAAQWTDGTTGGGTDDGYMIGATWNLSTLLNLCCNINVTTQYEFAGPNFYTPYSGADLDAYCDCWDSIYPGNAQGFTAIGSIQPWQGWTIFVQWLTGNTVSNSQSITSYVGGVSYAFSPGAKITLKYRDLSLNGVDQINVYRAQVDYGF